MSGLPTGTFTFLFTDVEGSTRLWERGPEAMSQALVRHDELLREAVEAHRGFVFKTMGDAFYAAFSTAAEAVEASLDAQKRLLSEEWEVTAPLRVRMALHTGTAEERDGEYFGPTLNRAARLLSSGHGGQVLLSLSTQELVRENLPLGAELRDLGVRRLKDLSGPEHVFQLTDPELPSSFPPLKTLDVRLNNLPIQPTLLLGREREVGEIADLLRREDVRLLTLTGTGGTGKTRLALQSAAELIDEFDDGVFFVALAPVSDPELVASTLAGALSVSESAGRTLEEDLRGYLSDKELLLVLDNFEQVVDAAPLVGEALSGCPGLKVLVTSRISLLIYGEHEYAVRPLELPDPGSPAAARGTEALRGDQTLHRACSCCKHPFLLDKAKCPGGRRDLRASGRAASGNRACRSEDKAALAPGDLLQAWQSTEVPYWGSARSPGEAKDPEGRNRMELHVARQERAGTLREAFRLLRWVYPGSRGGRPRRRERLVH